MSTAAATHEPPQTHSEHPSPQRATQGLLAIWHGVERGFEPSFDEWYDRQHHLERVGIPGFVRARRYLNLDGGPRYFSRYDVEESSVLASTAYLGALNNPTAWTRTLMPRYRNTTRAVFRFDGGAGEADGADLVTLRFSGDHAAAGEDVGSREMSALVAAPGVLRVEKWRADTAVSGLRTEEKKLRGAADDVVGLAILVEGSSIDRVSDAVARHLLPCIAAPAIIDRYRFVFQLDKR